MVLLVFPADFRVKWKVEEPSESPRVVCKGFSAQMQHARYKVLFIYLKPCFPHSSRIRFDWNGFQAPCEARWVEELDTLTLKERPSLLWVTNCWYMLRLPWQECKCHYFCLPPVFLQKPDAISMLQTHSLAFSPVLVTYWSRYISAASFRTTPSLSCYHSPHKGQIKVEFFITEIIMDVLGENRASRPFLSFSGASDEISSTSKCNETRITAFGSLKLSLNVKMHPEHKIWACRPWEHVPGNQ